MTNKLLNPLRISGQAPKATCPTCPTCGATLHAQAIVTAFNEPAEWTAFYGQAGHRWIRCRGKTDKASFTHFVVQVRGKLTHRLAWYELK